MPLDPNEPTSDVGQMYRQYLQSKGMPLTSENMQRVIAQSQREPGLLNGQPSSMIPGLTVEQDAQAPPNIAGASASSSGAPTAMPKAMPTGIPQSAPIPAQAMPTPPIPPQQPGQPQQAVAQTAPPGQPPGPASDGGNNIVQMLLTALGVGGGALANRLGSGGPVPGPGGEPPLSMSMAPQEHGALPPPQAQIGNTPQISSSSGGVPEMRIQAPQGQLPAPEVTPTSPIGNILHPGTSPTGLPMGPSSSIANIVPGLEPFNDPITGVRPVGVQPPPTAPVSATRVPARAPSSPTRVPMRVRIP